VPHLVGQAANAFSTPPSEGGEGDNQLDRGIHRQADHAGGAAGVPAAIPERFHEKVGRAVQYSSVFGKRGGAGDKPVETKQSVDRSKPRG